MMTLFLNARHVFLVFEHGAVPTNIGVAETESHRHRDVIDLLLDAHDQDPGDRNHRPEEDEDQTDRQHDRSNEAPIAPAARQRISCALIAVSVRR